MYLPLGEHLPVDSECLQRGARNIPVLLPVIIAPGRDTLQAMQPFLLDRISTYSSLQDLQHLTLFMELQHYISTTN